MKRMVPSPQLSFSEAFNAATDKIFQFSGRSRRSEYWWMTGLVFLVSLVLTPLAGFVVGLATIPLSVRRLHDTGRSGWWCGAEVIMSFFFVVCLICDVVEFVNADLGEYEDAVVYAMVAKYLLWLGFLSIYRVVLLIFMCIDSEKGANRYGESPKYGMQDVEETNGWR